jgi:hypothetical protein
VPSLGEGYNLTNRRVTSFFLHLSGKKALFQSAKISLFYPRADKSAFLCQTIFPLELKSNYCGFGVGAKAKSLAE